MTVREPNTASSSLRLLPITYHIDSFGSLAATVYKISTAFNKFEYLSGASITCTCQGKPQGHRIQKTDRPESDTG